jgi:hypothetical protein
MGRFVQYHPVTVTNKPIPLSFGISPEVRKETLQSHFHNGSQCRTE